MILVDSDVLIAHLRGIEVARDWLIEARTATGRLSVSVVSYAEITGGMRSAERRAVERLFGGLAILDVTRAVGARAGEFRRTWRRSYQGIGTVDYLIAATAAVAGLDLATLNVKHFPMFGGLEAPFTLPN